MALPRCGVTDMRESLWVGLHLDLVEEGDGSEEDDCFFDGESEIRSPTIRRQSGATSDARRLCVDQEAMDLRESGMRSRLGYGMARAEELEIRPPKYPPISYAGSSLPYTEIRRGSHG